ncbi:LuxR family transcriptional regulator [Micromonospora sp. MH33]|uniref:ATP-binding protein n=1 Tax=Micromonospora sp. MH33 TaxID=1945509 RepID=UPI000D14B083|nr:LuxR family transcriptional regulator [Micromonospora sp. MH33]
MGSPASALVGRDVELTVLRELIVGVTEGRGGMVWLDGEPGIGKSALISTAIADAARLGCAVYGGSAPELLPPFPLQVLLDALRVGRDSVDPLRAPLAGLLRGEGRSELLTPRDVAALLAEQVLALVDRLCSVTPVVLVLDDAQWADEASLSVWSRLGRAAAQVPLLLVTACRPLPRRPEVAATRRDLVERGATVLPLGALSAPQVIEVVGELVGAVPSGALGELAGQAGGNPLYAREAVDALVRESRITVVAGVAELTGAGEWPGSLPEAIGRRLGFLPERTRSVLGLAAVLGCAFTVDDLGVVSGQPATALMVGVDEAVAGGVLAASGDRLVFRHGLIRQALYEAMPASLRAALHRQAARALAGAGAPVERVAEQLLAGPAAADEWMVDWVAREAAALTYRAPRVAVELLTRVRGAVDDDPRRERLDADLTVALSQLGDNEQVERLARPVLAFSRDPVVAARVAWTLGYALMRMGRYEQAVEAAEHTLERPELPAIWAARLYALRALALIGVGRFDEARAAAARAEAEGRQAGDRLAVGYALHTLALIEHNQRRDVAAQVALIDRALAVLGDEPSVADLRLLLMINRAGGLDNLGRPAEADHAFGQATVFAERAGTPPRLGHLRAKIADYSFYRGRWDEALAELQAAADLPVDMTYRLAGRGVRALIAVHRDDLPAAEREFFGVEELTSPGNGLRLYADLLLVAWALAAEREGRSAEALARLLAVFDPEGDREFPQLTPDTPMWLAEVVRLALVCGDRATATAAARANAAAQGQASPATTAAAGYCAGLLAADPAGILAAADTFHRIGYPLFGAQALENAAVLYAERGDQLAARATYARAVEVYTSLDAAWDIMRADARLRPHGIRRGRRGPRRRPTTGREALTATERKIADLVTAGQSNPDIAAQLFLSRRTVETHVSHILAKLGAHSRVDIARELATSQ